MVTRLMLVMGIVLALSVSLQARLPDTGKPHLESATIIFHVKDDDKDHDSYESITVTSGEWTVGTLDNAGAGQVWKDQSDTARLSLTDVDRKLEPSDVEKIHVDINHATKGNDNFKFAFTVKLNFSNGQSYTYDHKDKIELSKDHGHGSWNVERSK